MGIRNIGVNTHKWIYFPDNLSTARESNALGRRTVGGKMLKMGMVLLSP